MTDDFDYVRTTELVELLSLAQDWTQYGHDPRAEGLFDRVQKVLAAGGGFDDLAVADREFLQEALAHVEAGNRFNPPPVLDFDDEDPREGLVDDDGAGPAV